MLLLLLNIKPLCLFFCTVWELFELGLLSFAIGHVFYTLAFGFKPRDYKKLLMSVVAGTVAYAYIAPGVKGES